ncbi:MAG TPA: SurA N-terminal domain-containing protein [Methylovirgula sp.]|nr:SurA N-terminal domain-containing protein [Methylovirgula sp.]
MLDALRASSQTWFGRTIMAVVMGFIIIAFGFWGIADIFRGFGANRLAKVGSIEITVDQYRSAYQNELLQLQQRQRRAITGDEAHAMGLDRQVLARLISDAVLDQEAHRLGLAMSDKELAKRIYADEAFKGPNGQFDHQLFEDRLRDAGMTERGFVSDQRADYLRQEMITALNTGFAAPNAMLELINRYYNETRAIDYIVLPKSAAGSVPAPSDTQLKDYFEAHRATYRTPEYRKLSVLVITPRTLAAEIAKTISDADVRKRYDEVKASRYTQPEHRMLQQIVFPDQASANAASDKLAKGETFDALIAERKLTAKDTNLGVVTKADLVDKAVADAGFALPKDGISKPVKTQFGWAILRVTQIVPPVTEPLEAVKGAIVQELALARATGEVNKIHDAIEDQRANGKSVADAAKSSGLEARTIDAIDAQGHDKSGKPVADLGDASQLVKAAFASDVGVDNEPIGTRDGGTIWFDVLGVEPARAQNFDEVKNKVAQAWTDEETSRRLSAKAAELVQKLDKGETLASIAASQGNLAVKHMAKIKRDDPQDLSREELGQVFDRKLGAGGSAMTGNGDRMLFKVVDAKVPPLDLKRPDFRNIIDQMKSALDDDLIEQYVTQLQGVVGVQINQQALASIIGAPPESD